MNFTGFVPKFQEQHSFWSVLGTIGGLASFAIPGVGPILGSTILSAATGAGQAVDSYNAEKKAAKQQGDAASQAGALYAPYNARGTQATNTLAGLLGMPDLPAGATAGGTMNARSAVGNEVTGNAVPRVDTPQPSFAASRLSDLGGPSPAQQQTRSSYSTIRLMSPDGTEVEDVPEEHAELFLRQGARRVS